MSHWYDKGGSPQYEVKSKSGSMRATTLRDARKFEWVPSVSTIWKDMVASPGLNRYYQDQLFNAMLDSKPQRLNQFDEEDRANFKKRVFALSKEHSLKSAERGTYMHNLIEQQLLTGSCGSQDPNEIHMVMQTLAKMREVCGDQDWKVEKSFAHPMGYGGKIDVYSDEWVVDFKTKEVLDEGKKPDVYDSHGVQLAAYNHGIGGGRKLLNLFISVSSPGYVVDYEWEERERLFSMFETALKLWQLTKRYDTQWQA